MPISDLLQALIDAIEAKRTSADGNIVLVLAAYDSPAYALRLVVEAFRESHTGWARQVGWREIWLAGPSTDLVQRLDGAEEATDLLTSG
ncbi:hypothetical protein OG535_40390 [Kitasatospora sp. NBC_00085]|uniref:hypothetical protein n=1 Tax=unclassified Kitasatospora TaxID=2633591 RepID=UPI00324834A4